MLTNKMEEALNIQLGKEMFSSYLYLSMSSYCDGENLKGYANWLEVQFQEEMSHFKLLYDYILQRGGKVLLAEIAKPKSQWNNIKELFDEVLAHEKFITRSILDLVDTAKKEKDFSTETFLHWFVLEQTEEESNVEDIIGDLSFIDGKNSALLMLDREMKTRVFVEPSLSNK